DGRLFIVILADGGKGLDESGAAAMPGSTPTSHPGRIVEVSGGIRNDAREVLCENAGARWQVRRQGTCWRQVVPEINDPSVAHDAAFEANRCRSERIGLSAKCCFHRRG